MDWHTLTEAKEKDAAAFENAAMKKIGLIPEIVVRYRSPYFQHIFSERLFGRLLQLHLVRGPGRGRLPGVQGERALFDPKTAKSFRDNILSKGNTREPMDLYKAFRGREPKVEPLLKARGLLK